MVSIQDYHDAEIKGLDKVSNRIMAAACPLTFQRLNYPMRIFSNSQLKFYADALHEGRAETDFNSLLGGAITKDEWETWQRIYRCVRDLVPVTPRGSLVRAQYSYRAILDHFKARPFATIVEIGPGSGYLSAMLNMGGFTVIPIEVTQAFYIWQSTLFSNLLGSHFYAPLAPVDWTKPARVCHTPWWEFYRADTEILDSQKVDLVVANHCLTEMSVEAAMYIARLCRQWECPIHIEGVGYHDGDISRLVHIFEGIQILSLEKPFPLEDATVSLDEVRKFWREDPRTPDEKWLETLYGKGHYS